MIIKHCFENVKKLNLPPRPRTPLLPEGGEFGKQNERMKNLTNILSYLWLLLLMAVTACSDLEEEVGPMHVEEEVELNIQLHVPDMQASTREEMVITENISSIVAIAFDESGDLIKKVDAILSDQDHENHRGTLKIKVPKRTQTIHFLGNYTKNDIEEESITSLETLNNFTTTDDTTMPTMRYWGMTTFDGSNINQPVTLYRNMAKLTLKTGDGFTPSSCYIAGFVNRNISGTIVPGGHAVGDTPTIPNNVGKGSYEEDNSLGNVYYLFEHANVKNNSPLYVIIEVAAKYYKVAFAAGDTYFPILRNRAYEITVTEPLDEMYAEADYPAAVNSQYPINDLVITNVPMTVTASPTEVLNQSGQTFTVTVTIPGGITELNEPTHDAFDITPPNSLTPQNGKYTITEGNYDFTFTVKPDVEAGDKTISFSGRGKYKSATGSANIGLYDNVQLTVTADPATIYNTAGSTRNVTVTVPEGITTLTIPSATTDAFIVTPQNGLSANNDGSYTVSAGDYLFTLQLRTDGDVGSTKTVTFNGSGQYKRATGSTTLTLEQAPAQEILSEYELWVENSAWKGSTNYDTFFTWNGDISAGDASNLESTFYDDGANAHKSRHMVMGQNNSISFTIPDTRYLTLLVASNNGNTPSINLTGTLTDDTWATATSEDDVVPDNYNFGKGEIGTNGRLICYTLPAGTYTLQGSSTSYLLYYLRVSTEKPTMTDIVQPTVSDYSLSWSGGEWGNWTYVENGNLYVVDDDAKTFTLTYTGLGLTEGTLSLSNSSLTIPRYNEEQDTYTINGNSAEITNANVGTYSYTIGSGEISNPTYKYSNFYDKIALKAVNGNGSATVKHSVKLKLTNGDIYQDASKVVDYYDLSLTDPRLAICTPETRINTGRSFTFKITENWTYREATNKTLNNGSSMMSQTDNTFTIAQGQETSGEQTWEHPFWYTYIYYLDWGSFTDTSNANRSLSTMTISTGDTDIWFSYKNQGISKSMVINVNQNPGEVVSEELNLPLDIELDFYRKYSNGTTDESYDNLIYGVSRVGLKATITIPNEQDPADYYGKKVYLQGAFSDISGKGNAGIHWDNSRDSGNDFEIAYKSGVNHDGTQLQFQIENGKTEYDIEWVFKGGSQYDSSNNSGNVRFTYTISAQNGSHRISGQNSATLTIKRSADIYDGSIEFNNWNDTTFDEIFPIGTNISLTYSKGGIAKFLNGYWQMLHIPEFENDYESDTNFYIRVGAGSINFDVSEQIKLYNNNTNNEYVSNLSSSLVALRIQGNEGSILQRVTVTAPPSAFPNNDPNYVPNYVP